jgi:hypothetical protein
VDVISPMGSLVQLREVGQHDVRHVYDVRQVHEGRHIHEVRPVQDVRNVLTKRATCS